jgi:transposase
LLADARGCPVAISAFEGNVGDPQTLLPQVDKLQQDFALASVILVGDRGMISQKQIDALKARGGVEWIAALKSGAIRRLVDDGCIQLGLFDERNLFECTHEDFPGERLVACRNPQLAELRAAKRRALLEATVKELDTVRRMVADGRLKDPDKIGVRVGRVVNKYKVAKHVVLEIERERFAFRIDDEKVAEEAALDGLYVIRTALPAERVTGEEAVRHYKDLAHVEAAFRSVKSDDLQIRPIRRYTEERVRAHLFLCMLAYYVKWHMSEAWRPLVFADEDPARRAARDPVAPATRSEAALEKAATKTLADGSPAHSFRTLLDELATIGRNTCRHKPADADEVTFEIDTTPNAKQRAALALIDAIRP